MTVAIIGTGRIGAALGRAWVAKGHSVVFGVRDPGDTHAHGALISAGAQVVSVDLAGKNSDVVVLAVPYAALDDVLEGLGDLAGKVVIDCTNAVGKGMTLTHGHTTSAAEQLQARVPRAAVFKSFNAQGAENISAPVYGEQVATNFFCGDDPAARETVRKLVADVGFDPVDAGPLKNARLLEPLMVLWVCASQALGTRELAFRLMHR